MAEVVPFQVVRSDVDPESDGGGLSGQPAFSSVLTVMAETVEHPANLDQSRALPTVSRDETHTTQWPSRSSSRGSDESSSSSSFVGDSFGASSGLIFSMSQKPTTPPQAIWSRVSSPSHTLFFKDGKKNLSSFPFWSLTSMSSSAPTSSSVPSSLLSLFYLSSSTEWINKAVSSQGQGTVSSPASQTETAALSSAGPQGWMDSLTTAKPTSLTVPDLHAFTQEMQNTTSKPANFLNEANTKKHSEMTTHALYSLAEKIPVKFINATSRYMSSGAKISTNILYSDPNNGVNFSDNSPTQIQSKSLNSVSGNNLESTYSFLFNQESQAVQRQQGTSQIPTSVLLSARAKGYSLSSHVTQQMLQRTAYIQTEEKTAADRNNLAHKSSAANSSVTPTMAFTPRRLFFRASSSDQTLLSQTVPDERRRIPSSTESSEHASNPGDLLMALGPRLPAININHNQGEIPGAEFRSASTQAYLENSLPLTQLRPESGSILHLSTEAEVPLSRSDSDLLKNVQKYVTEADRVKDATHRSQTTLNIIFTPNGRKKSASGPTEFSKFLTYKNERQSSSHRPQPSYLPLSHSNHDPTEDPVNIFVSKEVTPLSSLERPLQTQSFFSVLNSFPTPALPFENSVELAGSTAETFAPIKSQGIAEFQTNPRNSITSNVLHGDEPSAHFHQNAERSYISPFFRGNGKSSAIYKTSHLLEQLTTRLPAFMTSENLFVLNNVSESSDKKSFPKSPPPEAFDGALELVGRLSHKGYGTFSPLAESENILTPKTNFSSLGLITSVRSDNSNSFSGRQTAVSSAVTSSFSDGQNSVQTSSAIFSSFGTKLMTLYTKRKATRPMPLQSSALKSENASSAFDRAKSNLPADGSSYEHQRLEDRQEHNVDILNSDDSTSVTSDPAYPTHPAVGEDPYITYVKGSSEYLEGSTDLPPAYLKSAVDASSLPEVNSNTAATPAWGSDVSLPLSFIITDSETSSSQTNSFALAYKSEHRGPVVALQSPASVSDSAVTPLDFTTAQKGSVSQTAVSSSLLQSSLPSLSFSSFSSSFPQFSSLFMKPIPPLSHSDKLPVRATVHPVSSVSVESTFSLPSPNSTSSLGFDHSQEVTGMFLLTEPEIDELTTETSKSAVFTFPKDKEASLKPSQSDRVILSADPIEGTSQVSPVTPQQVTTTASEKLTTTTLASTTTPTTTSTPSVKVTTHSVSTTTPQPTPVTRRTTTTTTTIRTYTSRRTFTSPIQRPSPPRGVTTIFTSPFTTTTEPPPPQCNITERLWVKTGQQTFYSNFQKFSFYIKFFCLFLIHFVLFSCFNLCEEEPAGQHPETEPAKRTKSRAQKSSE